jgi:hypothetical protein
MQELLGNYRVFLLLRIVKCITQMGKSGYFLFNTVVFYCIKIRLEKSQNKDRRFYCTALLFRLIFFAYHLAYKADVAQLVEQLIRNQ